MKDLFDSIGEMTSQEWTFMLVAIWVIWFLQDIKSELKKIITLLEIIAKHNIKK